MRIAYVINSVEGGGPALYAPSVIRVLRAHGATVEVFALTRRDGRGLVPMHESGLMTHVRPGGEKDHLAALAWLGRELTTWRPDVIWTSLTRATLLGQLVGRRLRVPVVSWQHAAFLKPANEVLLRARRGATSLWVTDSHCVREFAHARLRIPPSRLTTWPLFAADPDAPAARPWVSGEPVRLGMLGRLHPVKGHDVLLNALCILRANGFAPPHAFDVALAGDGAERDALEATIRNARLGNVRLTGYAERPREFLAGLHLYLQPSRSEGLCIAAHEAMQAGLPTVVSAVGELPYSMQDGQTGLLVPPNDPAALARALARLLTHPDQLAPMGVAARRRVLTRFSVDAFEAAGAAICARLPALVPGVAGAVPLAAVAGCAETQTRRPAPSVGP